MSKEADNKDIEYWKVFKFLIKKLLGSDQDLIRDFALHLCDNAVISIEQRKSIHASIKTGLCVEAVDHMFGFILEKNKHFWKSMTLVALYENDCPGNKNMVALITKLLELPLPRVELFSFVENWDKFVEMKDKLIPLWVLTWPVEQTSSSEWPHEMLIDCAKEDNEKSRNFMQEVQSMISESEEMDTSDTPDNLEITRDKEETTSEKEKKLETSHQSTYFEEIVRCIFQNSLIMDDEITEFAAHLHDNDLISKNQRKKFTKNVKEKPLDAVDYLLYAMIQHQPEIWSQLTLHCLKLDDCPGNKNMIKLLISILEKPRIDSNIYFMISEWDLLSKLQDQILPQYQSVWSDEIDTDCWPISIILKCLKTDREVSLKFIAGVKSVISHAKMKETSDKHQTISTSRPVVTKEKLSDYSESATCTIPIKRKKSGSENSLELKEAEESKMLTRQTVLRSEQGKKTSTDLPMTDSAGVKCFFDIVLLRCY